MPSLAFLDFCCEETGRGSEGQLGFVGGEFAEDLGGGAPKFCAGSATRPAWA